MTVKEIVQQYLKDNDFEGLFNEDVPCGCVLADLMPCQGNDGACDSCLPGYRCHHKEPAQDAEGECEGGDECKCIGAKKEDTNVG